MAEPGSSGEPFQRKPMQRRVNASAIVHGECDQERSLRRRPLQQVTGKAQRTELLDEQIRNAFERYQLENQLDWQRENSTMQFRQLLKRAVPICNGDVSFAASTMYFGTGCDSLATILESSYALDKQQRKPIAYIQSPGCGKTRTVMQLALDHDYVVLPLLLDLPTRNIYSELLKVFVEEEASLKKHLGAQPSASQIRTFSDRCLRLVYLVLFSLQALLKHCVETKLVDVWNPANRYQLAVLLLLRCDALENWLVAYFDQHKQAILDMTTIEFETLVNEIVTDNSRPGTRAPKVVFLLHRADCAQYHCQGYCLRVDAPDDDVEIQQQWWLTEQHRSDDNGTDLLYQLKQVMLKCCQIDGARMAFVLCSSDLTVADSVAQDGSAKTDGDMIRFSEMHWFTADEVRQYIEEYFGLPDEIYTQIRMAELAQFGFPCFVSNLLENLAQGSVAYGVARWLHNAIEEALFFARNSAMLARSCLVKRRFQPTDDVVENCLLVYTVAKLCGGECVLRDKFIPSLVRSGNMRLTMVATNELACDEPLYFKALETRVSRTLSDLRNRKKRDPVLHQLLTPWIMNVNHVNEQSVEGCTAERILAWHFATTAKSTSDPVLQYSRLGLANDAMQALSVQSLPKSHCGPDLMVSVSNLSPFFAVMRCKMQSMELDKFNKMLTSLHPARFFEMTKKKDGCDECRIAERQRWLEIRCKQLPKVPRFFRIVFAARGFALHVQYLVSEYNATVRRQTSKWIHLLNLHDLQQQMDEVSYAALERLLLKLSAAHTHVLAHETVTLQSVWMRKSKRQKKRTSLDELQKLCLQRNISVTTIDNEKGHKFLQSKTTEELISELDAYNVTKVLDGLNWGLEFF